MAKVLLAEDDNNLREIYEARLAAEGYDIVTAQNGEEALVAAKQNKPDLIISDVMMPRISGFEMLDILRNTPEIQDTKVIMLTALGQAEDQSRAGKLGANKYLVKSQVTLEDIVNAAHALLAESGTEAAPAAEPEAPAVPEVAEPAVAEPAPVETPAPVAAPEAPAPVVEPVATPTVEAPVAMPEPVTAVTPTPELTMPEPTAAEAQTTDAEEASVEEQIANFASSIPADPIAAVDPTTTDNNEATEPAVDVAPVETTQETLINEAVDNLTEAVNAPPEPVLPPSQKTVPGEELVQAPEIVAPTPVSQQVEPHLGVMTPESATPTPEAPAEPAISTHATPMATAPEPVTQPEPSEAPAEPVQEQPASTEDTNDFQQVSGKKVIAPIGNGPTGPNLEELLAKEAAKEAAEAGPTAIVSDGATPEAPAPEVTPQPEPQKTQSGIDPSSIAL